MHTATHSQPARLSGSAQHPNVKPPAESVDRWLSARALLTIFGLSGSFIGAGVNAAQIDGFTPTGSMSIARSAAEAITLNDGRVLVIGGYSGDPATYGSLEVYNPSTGAFTSVPAATCEPANGFTATLLLDGRVLVAGCGYDGWNRSFVFNPSTNTMLATGNLITGRKSHTATRLVDGRVLIAGGQNCVGSTCTTLSSGEIYDPATGMFSAAGTLNTARLVARSLLLDSGKVLIAGGVDSANFVSNSAELYDPATNTFSATANLTNARQSHAASMLRNGKVLVTGGACCNFSVADIFDPVTASFTMSGDMPNARWSLTSNAMKDGGALIVGGYAYNPATTTFDSTVSAERYNSATQLFTSTGPMSVPRSSHASATLHDGRVLVCGGMTDRTMASSSLSSCEIYTPDVIFSHGFE